MKVGVDDPDVDLLIGERLCKSDISGDLLWVGL